MRYIKRKKKKLCGRPNVEDQSKKTPFENILEKCKPEDIVWAYLIYNYNPEVGYSMAVRLEERPKWSEDVELNSRKDIRYPAPLCNLGSDVNWDTRLEEVCIAVGNQKGYEWLGPMADGYLWMPFAIEVPEMTTDRLEKLFEGDIKWVSLNSMKTADSVTLAALAARLRAHVDGDLDSRFKHDDVEVEIKPVDFKDTSIFKIR
jgi:hypothetical protein